MSISPDSNIESFAPVNDNIINALRAAAAKVPFRPDRVQRLEAVYDLVCELLRELEPDESNSSGQSDVWQWQSHVLSVERCTTCSALLEADGGCSNCIPF
jgi:hypothetical protein